MKRLEENLRDWPAADLAGIAGTFMPFGKYGPGHHPPPGSPLFDLPFEDLCGVGQKDWPQGRLGDLLRSVHQPQTDGGA